MSEGEALVFARCAGFVVRAPGFSHPSVPPPLRAGFAFVLSPSLAQAYAPHVQLAVPAFIVALAGEFCIGAAIGIAASMLNDGAYAGGRALDDYVGIRASVPTAGLSSGAGFGRLWSLAFTTGFFVLGGYRIAFDGFAQGFETLPAPVVVASTSLAVFAAGLPATLIRAAFTIAGPAVVLALVVQFGLAAIARIVPRFATFTLAFPVVFGVVLVATLAALPLLLPLAAWPQFDLAGLHTTHDR